MFLSIDSRHPSAHMTKTTVAIIVCVLTLPKLLLAQRSDSIRVDFTREAKVDVSSYIKTFPEVSQQADRFRRSFRVRSNIPFVLGPAAIISMQALMRDVYHIAAEQLQNMQVCKNKKCITAIRMSYGLDAPSNSMRLLYQPVVLVQKTDIAIFEPVEITNQYLQYNTSSGSFVAEPEAQEWIASYQQNVTVDRKGRGFSYTSVEKGKDTESITFPFQELVEYYYSIFPESDTEFRNALYIHNGSTLHTQPGTTRKLPRHTLFVTYYDFGFAGRDGGLLGPAADAGHLCPESCNQLQIVLK